MLGSFPRQGRGETDTSNFLLEKWLVLKRPSLAGFQRPPTALGAFLVGMVVGQTEVSHQAATNALPMRDAFTVLFFVSVGMLFDPQVILSEISLRVGLLGIILLCKPLVALAFVWALRYSFRTGLTVAIALAQIGEFSFLLGR